MKVYIIDTNLLFSAIINPESLFSHFFRSIPPSSVDLFAPSKLLFELEEKESRMVLAGKIDSETVRSRKLACLQNITIVPDTEIPFDDYMSAIPLVRDVDYDDISFVALTNHLDGVLVTGDKKLAEGLRAKGYGSLLSFPEMLQQIGLI